MTHRRMAAEETIARIENKLDELTRSVSRIELLVLGDGVSGLASRVECLEGTVNVGDRSLSARIASIEQRLDAINRVTWLVASTLVVTVVAAILQLIMR